MNLVAKWEVHVGNEAVTNEACDVTHSGKYFNQKGLLYFI